MTGDDARPVDVDVVIVGAGFAGLYALHSLRASGLRAVVLETADEVGGTWYWNRYPGARCDANSLFYCFGFDDDLRRGWSWTQRYPRQEEIRAYLNYVADRLDLRRDIVFSARVSSAHFDEGDDVWTVRTGSGGDYRAQHLVLAVGALSCALRPEVGGLDDFRGRILSTSSWPVVAPDLTGERVGVIGTGSSAVQLIPELAGHVERLVVFQRTANYVLPARNAALDPAHVRSVDQNYAVLRERIRRSAGGTDYTVPTLSALEVDPEELQRVYQQRWDRGGAAEFVTAFTDIRTNPVATETASDFIRAKIRELVEDPRTAELLTPVIAFGSKRPQVSDGYYEAFNRADVDLVDIGTPRTFEFTATGVRVSGTGQGARDHELDTVVFATGFDAFTGSIHGIDIRGLGGVRLAQRWADGPKTNLGIAVSGFPNLFLITGPGSPSVLGNVVVAIEQHVEWITELMTAMRRRGKTVVESTPDAEQSWSRHVEDVGRATVLGSGNSWYTGANVPGKARVVLPYAGGYGRYRQICDDVAQAGYRGFTLSSGHARVDDPADSMGA